MTLASNIVYDYKNGFVIDAATGVVLDRIYDFEDWLNPRFDEQREFERKRRHSYVEAYLLPRNKLLLRCYYLGLEAARALGIDSKLLRLELKRAIVKTINILYKEYREIREQSIRSYTAAVLYATARMVNAPVGPRQIIDQLDAIPWKAYELYSKIKQQLGLAVDRRQEVLQYIDKFIAMHNYPDRLYYWCLWIIQRLDDYFFSGKQSKVLAAAIIDLARILRFNEVLRETKNYWKAYDALREFVQQDIAKILGVSEQGIRIEKFRIMSYLEQRCGIRFKPIDKYASIYIVEAE